MPVESNTSSVISFCVSAVILAAAQILQESWRFLFEFTARFASLLEMSDKQDDFAADVCSNCTGRLAQLLSPRSRCGRSGVRFRADQIVTVSPTACYRCDVCSELCSPGAAPRRWAPPLVTRLGVIWRV